MVIRIYVEGGGDNKALKTECRKAFSKFIENAGFDGRMPRVSACGSRNEAYSDFRTAVANKESDEFPMLLVDSEDPVDAGANKWNYLKTRDKWTKPKGTNEDSVHLMVQCMESWFLADKEKLEEYFGKDFKVRSLPKNKNIEQILKKDVYDGLNSASKSTQKGAYDKGSHSFSILETISLQRVRDVSPYANSFFETLDRKTNE